MNYFISIMNIQQIAEEATVCISGRVVHSELKNNTYQVTLNSVKIHENQSILNNSSNSDSELSSSLKFNSNSESSSSVNSNRQVINNDKSESKDITSSSSLSKKVHCILYFDKEQDIKVGESIMVKGTVKFPKEPTNQGQFDACMYYKGIKVAFFIRDTILLKNDNKCNRVLNILVRCRNSLHKRLDLLTNEENASILQAMLLGESSYLNPEIKKLYQDNAISHILVISGLHFSMIGMCLYSMVRRVGGTFRIAGVISIVFLFFYGVMNGFTTSSVRAFLMFSIAVGATITGRTYDMPGSLAVSILVILWQNPYSLFQCGFLLSAGAILGIMIVIPVIIDGFEIRSKILMTLLSSLAIQLFTLPILLYFFFETALYSVFVNLLVVPLSSFTMLFSFLALAGSLLSLSFGRVLMIPANLIFMYYKMLCEFARKIPFSKQICGQPKIWQIVCYYVILFLLAGYLLCWNKKRNSCKRILMLSIVFSCMIYILIRKPKGYLFIHMLDVGQGEAIFIQTPDESSILYDGGSTDVSKVGQYRIVPFIKSKGVGKIDYCIVSHLDNDHISGLKEIIEGNLLTIQCLILPDTSLQDDAFHELYSLAKNKKMKVVLSGKGSKISEKDLSISVFHPEQTYQTDSRNDTSIVMQLNYQKFSMLFTGDIEEGGEEKLIKEGLLTDVTVLQVAHHGSQYSTSQEFLSVVKPEVTLITCGKDNRYGHPHKALLDRLIAYHSHSYITMNEGAITVTTDGNSLGVYSFLKNEP